MLNSARALLLRRYLCRLQRHRAVLSGMLLCMACAAFLEPLLALMLKPLLDGGDDFLIAREWIPFFAGGVMLLLPAAVYGRVYLGGWLDITMQRDLRSDMAARLVQQPLGALAAESSGKTTTRFIGFVPSLTGATLPVFTALVQEPLKVIFYLTQMFYLQWELALIICVAMPPTALLIRILGRRMKKATARAQEETARTQSRLNESLALMPIIKLHGAAAGGAQLAATFSALRGALLRMQIIIAAGQPLSMLAIAIPSAVVLFYVVGALATNNMTVGDVAAFLGCMLLMPRSVRAITRAATVLESMLVAAHEVFGFLESPIEEDAATKTIAKTDGNIVFDNVFLHYDNNTRPALDGVSVNIRAGETVALVGRSGAGKTTLANLLPRFYTPQRGVVRLDGTDIREIALSSLRAQIAIVTQDALLFDDSIAANVCYPQVPDAANKAAIVRALENAAAADFVAAMPQAMDSACGENGRLLSGGQRQRIALARAFYRDSPVVILDEPTSALDAATEGQIGEAMQRLLCGRTAIIIAHRFVATRFADRIVVLDGGKVVAEGSAEELLQTCELYAKLANAQYFN